MATVHIVEQSTNMLMGYLISCGLTHWNFTLGPGFNSLINGDAQKKSFLVLT